MIVTKKSQELKNSQSVFFPEVVATVLSKAGWPIFLNIAQKKADAQYGKTTGSHSFFPGFARKGSRQRGDDWMGGVVRLDRDFFSRGNETTCCPDGQQVVVMCHDT
jgi:hypothetical protein